MGINQFNHQNMVISPWNLFTQPCKRNVGLTMHKVMTSPWNTWIWLCTQCDVTMLNMWFHSGTCWFKQTHVGWTMYNADLTSSDCDFAMEIIKKCSPIGRQQGCNGHGDHKVMNGDSPQQCSFGESRGASLVYHLSSLPVAKKIAFQVHLWINQPIGKRTSMIRCQLLWSTASWNVELLSGNIW